MNENALFFIAKQSLGDEINFGHEITEVEAEAGLRG